MYTDESDTLRTGLTFDIDAGKVSPIEAELLQNLLSNGLLTPLTIRLREELGLLHEIRSNVEFYNFGGLLYFIFEVNKNLMPVFMDEITKVFSQQKKAVDKRAFDCVFAAYTDGAEKLFDDSKGFAYELVFDRNITTPQSYVERNKKITYNQICNASQELFRPCNLIISINDIPNEPGFMDEIYEKKEVFRRDLGE